MQENNKNLLDNINTTDTLGMRLRKLRQEKGLSQAELAEKLGYKASASISSIESDKHPIDVEALKKLADLFDADIHWLITGKPSPGELKAVKHLKPFATAHMSDILKRIQALQDERRKLETIQHVQGMPQTRRLDEITEELENHHGYYQAIWKHLDEILKPFDEKVKQAGLLYIP